MIRQFVFGATCAGILAAGGLLPLPERDALPELNLSELPDFDLDEFNLSEPPALLANVGALVSELPEMGATLQDTVIRPGVARIAQALQPADAPTATTPNATAPERIDLPAKTVNFDLDRVELDATAKAELDSFLQRLAEVPDVQIGIYGHTDLTGTETYNTILGQARAEQVAAYLQGHGIAASRIAVVKSYGETAPMIATDAPDRTNRRVQVEALPMTDGASGNA